MICVKCNFYDTDGAMVVCLRCHLLEVDARAAIPGLPPSARPLERLTAHLKQEIDWLISQKGFPWIK